MYIKVVTMEKTIPTYMDRKMMGLSWQLEVRNEIPMF